jgi:hypothetical protein
MRFLHCRGKDMYSFMVTKDSGSLDTNPLDTAIGVASSLGTQIQFPKLSLFLVFRIQDNGQSPQSQCNILKFVENRFLFRRFTNLTTCFP